MENVSTKQRDCLALVGVRYGDTFRRKERDSSAAMRIYFYRRQAIEHNKLVLLRERIFTTSSKSSIWASPLVTVLQFRSASASTSTSKDKTQ